MDRPRKSPGPGLHAARKAAPTTPKAPVPAPRATRPWLLSTAAARRPRRPSQVVELDLQEERPPARIRDARFPRGAIAVIEGAQGERRIGVEQFANAEGRLQIGRASGGERGGPDGGDT